MAQNGLGLSKPNWHLMESFDLEPSKLELTHFKQTQVVDNRSLASITDVDRSSDGFPSPKPEPLDSINELLKKWRVSIFKTQAT